MPRTDLGDRRKDEGRNLIRALEQAGIEILAAFWVHRASLDEWRLVLVTPVVERTGRRPILRQVSDQLDKANGHSSFDLFDVEITGTQNPHVIDLIQSQSLTMMIESELYDIGSPEKQLSGVYAYFAKPEALPSPASRGGRPQ